MFYFAHNRVSISVKPLYSVEYSFLSCSPTIILELKVDAGLVGWHSDLVSPVLAPPVLDHKEGGTVSVGHFQVGPVQQHFLRAIISFGQCSQLRFVLA